MASSPELVVICTSRKRLGLEDEVDIVMGALDVPLDHTRVEHSPAIELFINRAREVTTYFELMPEDGPFVARTVRLLSGVPPSNELAGQRIAVLSPTQRVERMDAGLDLFHRGSGPPCHRTLRAAVQSSWELLDEVARKVSADCVPLSGGFTGDATAVVVAAEALDGQRVEDILATLPAFPGGEQLSLF